jgi:hypothetical protein
MSATQQHGGGAQRTIAPAAGFGAPARTGVSGGVLVTVLLLVAAALAGGLAISRDLSTTGYARYSSRRTDPFGASVYFNALRDAGDDVTRLRDFDDIAALDPARTALFFVAPISGFDAGQSDILLRFLVRGGRLVIFDPNVPAAAVGRAATNMALPPAPDLDFWKVLRVELTSSHTKAWEYVHPTGAMLAAARAAGFDPGRLHRWPTDAAPSVRFWDAHWQTLYMGARHGRCVPAMLERTVGAGTIVVGFEPAIVSNQTLSGAPDFTLLAWFDGGRSHIAVDESLHGFAVPHGSAWLMRRYGLMPAALALLLLLVLYAWQVAPSLLPPASTVAGEAFQSGESARTGTIRLLRRALAPSALLDRCAMEWKLEHRALMFVPGNEFDPAAFNGPSAQNAGSAAVRTENAARNRSSRRLRDREIVAGFNSMAAAASSALGRPRAISTRRIS